MSRTLYIVGPTASGKTGLAISIAKKYNGEVICADSRTIYKGLDVGTAKPSKEEQSGIPHYGLDLVSPQESFSAAEFVRLARTWISDIVARGKLPIVVGGTGLYIDALYYDFSFGDKADIAERDELEKLSLDELKEILVEKGYEMPENDKNKRYVIRAIQRRGVVGNKKTPSSESIIIGISPDKQVLACRIKERAITMGSGDVLGECRNLFDTYGYDAPGGSGNIYRALAPHFQSNASIEECMKSFETLDRRLAKRQITWFKRNKNIQWFENYNLAEKYLDGIL